MSDESDDRRLSCKDVENSICCPAFKSLSFHLSRSNTSGAMEYSGGKNRKHSSEERERERGNEVLSFFSSFDTLSSR